MKKMEYADSKLQLKEAENESSFTHQHSTLNPGDSPKSVLQQVMQSSPNIETNHHDVENLTFQRSTATVQTSMNSKPPAARRKFLLALLRKRVGATKSSNRNHKGRSDDSFQHDESQERSPMSGHHTRRAKSAKEFLELACGDKSTSMQLQSTILSCGDEEVKEYTEYGKKSYSSLLTERYGSFVLQKLIRRSVAFAGFVKKQLQEDFSKYAMNEFSSRIIQILAENDGEFLEVVLNQFCLKWRKLLKSISAVFCISACIKLVPQRCHDRILDLLVKDAHVMLRSKHHKRILVSFLDVCSHQHLDAIYRILIHQRSLTEVFNDKYLVYISKCFVRRRHIGFLQTLMDFFKYHIEEIRAAKYFKFFLVKINEPDTLEQYKSIAEGIRKDVLKSWSCKEKWEESVTPDDLEWLIFLAYVALTPLDNEFELELIFLIHITNHLLSRSEHHSKQL